jgi:predicted transcriptional regulator
MPDKINRSFETHIPRVRKIIENNPDMGFSKLHKQLAQNTGTKISKSTVSKCLKYLLFTGQIKKEQGSGRGAPVCYKLNEYPINYVSDLHARRECLIELLKSEDTAEYNKRQADFINLATGLVTETLIKRLISCSNMPSHMAANHFEDFIQTQFSPGISELLSLVRQPLAMNEETQNELLNFYNSITQGCLWQQTKRTKKESEEL